MNATMIEAISYAAPVLLMLGWQSYRCATLSSTLTNLRNNAHLRNEKGHIVRYANASREVRAKAEQN